MMHEQAPLLEIKDLDVVLENKRGRFKVVSEVGFTIHAGRTLGLVGESGSGKSMTAQAILRLPLSGVKVHLAGEIRLNGRDILEMPEKELRRMRGGVASIIFQDPMSCLNPIMTVGRQVLEAVRRHRKVDNDCARQKVYDLFHEVGLPDPKRRFKNYPHELSGGQQQRVMITIALAGDPVLLIADEPTTALDVTIQDQVMELLRDLQKKRRMAMLFISHDLNLVRTIADHAAVMRNGRILEYGPREDLFNRPAHPYTRALLACRPEQAPPRSKLPVISDFIPDENEASNFDSSRPLSHAIPKVTHLTDREYVSEKALEIKNLVVEYRSGMVGRPFRAVDGIDLELDRGKTLGLVGESGSGKSTAAKAIVRLQPVSSGRITVCGLNALGPKTLRKRLARLCQLVFQNPSGSLNPRLRILDILTEPLQTHGLLNGREQGGEYVFDLLDEVGLIPEHLARYPYQLSGGQRQRVSIARALALNPLVLICDEIVSSLDVSVQAQILNLLLDIQEKRGLAILFISHDLNVVRHLSDEIAVMHQGKIVEKGTTDEILSSPKTDYTRQLIGAAFGVGEAKSRGVAE